MSELMDLELHQKEWNLDLTTVRDLYQGLIARLNYLDSLPEDISVKDIVERTPLKEIDDIP